MNPYTEIVCEKLRQYLKNGTVQNICRICFTDLENTPISCEQKYTSICFYEELTSITINPNDNQTMNFCTECVSEIENCYKFRKKCIEANMMMEDISNEIGLIKFEGTENDYDRPLNNNLEIVSNSDLNVKQEDMKDECQVYEVEFLEESILESENSSKHVAVATRKKYREETTNLKLKKKTKTGSKVLKRGRPKRAKNVGVLDMATTIQETESNEEQKLNICLVCKKPFLNENDLMIHMSLHIQKRGWECNVCNKECKDRTTLRRHILRHMTVKPYRCDNCGKTFCELCDLKKHMRVHTGEIVVKNKCSTCKTTFGSRAALSEHRPCAAAPRWACWCGRALGSRRLLASHQRVHDARKPHACPHCHKRFRHDSTLITHLRTHTGEKPYMCSVCGRTFIQGSNLSLHMRTHTGEKPYSCKTCPMKFSSGSSLKAHTLSHAEAKYKCEVCGKQLSPASIVGHRRLHAAGAGAGPRGGGGAARGRHACSLCGKSFSTPAVLREHTHLHTGERPFECKRCPKKFPTKTRLNKHEKNKHEIKVQKVKPKNQKRTKNKTKGQVITGTNYKFVNEIQLQDVTDSEDRLVIAVESEELHLQASGKTKADLENSNDNATCSPITDELNNENVIVVKEDIEVSETFIGSGHNEVSTSK